MAFDHNTRISRPHPLERAAFAVAGILWADLTGSIVWAVVGILWAVSTGASTAQARDRVFTKPHGTPAEIQQCVSKIEGSLHGRSILGSGDMSAYWQDRWNLEEDMGLTEYDVMVSRCIPRAAGSGTRDSEP
jgi:hypothetical protein